LLALTSSVVIYYFGATFPEYSKISKAEFNIPGLNDGFVPQGLNYNENSRTYFISGYMADNSASRIYILEEDKDTASKYITLTFENKDVICHFGGVAANDEHVWVSGDGYVYRIEKSSILNANNGDKIAAIDQFRPENGADFITIHNNHLLVGEFYLKDKYDTPPSHHIEVNNGETNKALAYAFELNSSSPYGIESTVPVYGLSLPDKSQGFTFTNDGKVVVSTSFSIPKSHILTYENVFNSDNAIIITINNQELPVYKLSSTNLVKDITAPTMSEEIIFKDNRVYILYESACSKYKLINRTRLTKVYSINI
jgi:hypothetical protein